MCRARERIIRLALPPPQSQFLFIMRYVTAPGIAGICDECFLDQTRFPHPPSYYCEHRRRLAVQVQGGWETFRDVNTDQVAELLSSCA